MANHVLGTPWQKAEEDDSARCEGGRDGLVSVPALHTGTPEVEEVGLEEPEKKGKTKQPAEGGWPLPFLSPGGNKG